MRHHLEETDILEVILYGLYCYCMSTKKASKLLNEILEMLGFNIALSICLPISTCICHALFYPFTYYHILILYFCFLCFLLTQILHLVVLI